MTSYIELTLIGDDAKKKKESFVCSLIVCHNIEVFSWLQGEMKYVCYVNLGWFLSLSLSRSPVYRMYLKYCIRLTNKITLSRKLLCSPHFSLCYGQSTLFSVPTCNLCASTILKKRIISITIYMCCGTIPQFQVSEKLLIVNSKVT